MSDAPEQSRSFLGWLGRVVFIGVLYAALGAASLRLAVQPGYASPLWPPAGIAFVAVLVCGYRYWPAAFMGNFLVNIGIAFDATSMETLLRSVGSTAGIGLAASLQAVAGATLVRRFVGYPSPLASPPEIVKFLFLGGPVSCLISSTLAVSILVANGAVLRDEALASWSAWWVGDSLGVLIVAPLLLILVGEPAGVWRRRRFSLGVPLVFTLGAALFLSIYSNALENRQIRFEFERDSMAVAESVQRHVGEVLEILYSVRGLFESSVEVNREEFSTFVSRTCSRHPEIQAVGWVPKIYAAGKSSLEGVARADGQEGYRVVEMSPEGELVPAGERPEYFPVFFIEPIEGNEPALGYDLGSEETRLFAMLKAEESGEPAATAPIELVQETEDELSTPIFLPVYDRDVEGEGAKVRHEHLLGYVNVVLRTRDLIDEALEEFDRSEIHLEIADVTDPGERSFIYRHQHDLEQHEAPGPESALPPLLAAGVSWDTTLKVATRQWELRFLPGRAFLYGQRSWWQWFILAGGLLFTGLLGALLLVVTGHTARVEGIVAERTRELDARTKELERSNRELEQFAYVASHDLQEPLRMVKSYMQLLERRYKDRLDSEGKEFIEFASEGAGRMHEMIRGLLDYSRIDARRRDFSEVDCEKALAEAEENLTVAVQESGAAITHDPLPAIRGDESQLVSLFQNLLANAIRYTVEEPPKIRVTAEKDEGNKEWVFSVRDNGIGIKPENAERIFVIFQRLHRKDEFSGTGIGLALCRKIVEGHGGRIWVEEGGAEGGSVFKFTLPV